jgi:hypothetical protein
MNEARSKIGIRLKPTSITSSVAEVSKLRLKNEPIAKLILVPKIEVTSLARTPYIVKSNPSLK